MSDIKIESTSSESPSTKREVVPKTEKPGIKEVKSRKSKSKNENNPFWFNRSYYTFNRRNSSHSYFTFKNR